MRQIVCEKRMLLCILYNYAKLRSIRNYIPREGVLFVQLRYAGCPALCIEYLHDLCLVWTFEIHGRQAADVCDSCKLVDRLFRVLFPGSREQAWISGLHARAAQDYAGSYHDVRFCWVLSLYHEREVDAELFMGFHVYDRRSFLFVSGSVVVSTGFIASLRQKNFSHFHM